MSIILFFYFGLLTEAFGQSNKPLSFKKQRTKLLREARTSVYLGDKNHQVVILESNFPKVARKFADKFPASTKPLWIKQRQESCSGLLIGWLYELFYHKS
jgi:hypothetical protein